MTRDSDGTIVGPLLHNIVDTMSSTMLPRGVQDFKKGTRNTLGNVEHCTLEALSGHWRA